MGYYEPNCSINTHQEAVMKKYIALIAAFIIIFQAFFSTTVFAAKDYILETEDYGDIRDTMSDTWVAIDDLGREVSTGATVRDIQEEKHVLMFYYTWHLPMHVQVVMLFLKRLTLNQRNRLSVLNVWQTAVTKLRVHITDLFSQLTAVAQKIQMY